MQHIFDFNSDNSQLIRQRQALESKCSKSGTHCSSTDGRFAYISTLLNEVIEAERANLDRAGVTLPIVFGLRDDPKKGPGCKLGDQRYVVVAGNDFIDKCTLLAGESLQEKGQQLVALLEGGPDSPGDVTAIVRYAKKCVAEHPADAPPFPKGWPIMNELELKAAFRHELSHIINGDPVHLWEVTPTWVKRTGVALAFGITLLFTGLAFWAGLPLILAMGVGVVAGGGLGAIGTYACWKGYASTDRVLREREMAADHTLIRDGETQALLAKHFKQQTVLEAINYVQQGKSPEATARLLQKEEGSHPSHITRWRAYHQRLSSVPK